MLNECKEKYEEIKEKQRKYTFEGFEFVTVRNKTDCFYSNNHIFSFISNKERENITLNNIVFDKHLII